MRVLLDSQKVSSSLVSVPVDLDSLVGLGGLGLPLGVDRRLRWLYSSCEDTKSIHRRPGIRIRFETSRSYYIRNAAYRVFVIDYHRSVRSLSIHFIIRARAALEPDIDPTRSSRDDAKRYNANVSLSFEYFAQRRTKSIFNRYSSLEESRVSRIYMLSTT